jgi:predicted regulator of Ras-like GTPase activity (Roadblock/LC7/MglB family)
MFSMTEKSHAQIESLLADLLVRAEGNAVFLCDRGGNILGQSSTNLYSSEENMAALAAGSFYATRELARILGEPEFHCVFHQGDRASLYMQSTSYDLLVLVIFGAESNPGLVRLYASSSVQALDDMMNNAENEEPEPQPVTVFEIDSTKQAFEKAPEFRAS